MEKVNGIGGLFSVRETLLLSVIGIAITLAPRSL